MITRESLKKAISGSLDIFYNGQSKEHIMETVEHLEKLAFVEGQKSGLQMGQKIAEKAVRDVCDDFKIGRR